MSVVEKKTEPRKKRKSETGYGWCKLCWTLHKELFHSKVHNIINGHYRNKHQKKVKQQKKDIMIELVKNILNPINPNQDIIKMTIPIQMVCINNNIYIHRLLYCINPIYILNISLSMSYR